MRLTLVKPFDLNLRSNGGIQIPQKTEGQTSASPLGCQGLKSYYVVFNDPNPGMYTSWYITELAVKGVSGIKHRKFKSFEEAKVSANIFITTKFKPPLELICSAEGLRPTFKSALTPISDRKIKL